MGKYDPLNARADKTSPEFKKALAGLVERAGGARPFAEASGIPLSTLYRYLKGDDPPSSAVIAMARAGGVPVSSLLDPGSEGSDLRQAGVSDPRHESHATVRIPVLNVLASAGDGCRSDRVEVETEIEMPAALIERLGSSKAELHFLRARGDSMAPTIADGALCLVDSGARDARAEGIFVLTVDGDVLVKRVQRAIGGLLLISDNPAYAPQRLSEADLDKVRIEGRVVWTEKVL